MPMIMTANMHRGPVCKVLLFHYGTGSSQDPLEAGTLITSILKTGKLCLLAPDQPASKKQGQAVLPGMPDLKPLVLTSEAKLFPSPFQAARFSQPAGRVVPSARLQMFTPKLWKASSQRWM